MDYEGIISDELDKDTITKNKGKKIKYKDLKPTPLRPYNIAYNLFYSQEVEEINKKTGVDIWFLERIKNIISFYKEMLQVSEKGNLARDLLFSAKQLGFSDKQIGEVFDYSWKDIRNLRKKWQILPKICQIDTLAGEFPAKTNYLYLSYYRDKNDIEKAERERYVSSAAVLIK